MGSFALLTECTSMTYWLCYLPSLILSVLWNFTFNRRYTFQSAANIPRAMALVAAYYVVFIPLSTWWGDALTKAQWNEYVVMIGTMLINFITEFIYQRFYVFSETINTNDIAKKRQEK